MISIHKQAAGSFWLLACFLFIAGCNNTQQQPINAPIVNENAVDSSKVDSTANHLTPQAGEHKFIVDISKMKFNPDQLIVQKGDTVVWVNNDFTNHCVTRTDSAWTSATIEPGKYWQKVIDQSEDYFCAIHVVMKGKILVK